ncbi:hypothetical protein D1872_89970 [compost metagenome]
MDFKSIADYGTGVVAIVAMFFIIKTFMNNKAATDKMQAEAHKATNAVVQANTKAINQLTLTLEKGNIADEQFRTDMRHDVKAVKGMVHQIHEKVVH